MKTNINSNNNVFNIYKTSNMTKIYYKSYSGDRTRPKIIADTLNECLPNDNIGIIISDFDVVIEGKANSRDNKIYEGTIPDMIVYIFEFLNLYHNIKVMANLIYYFYEKKYYKLILQPTNNYEHGITYNTIMVSAWKFIKDEAFKDEAFIVNIYKNKIYGLYKPIINEFHSRIIPKIWDCANGFHPNCSKHESFLDDYNTITKPLNLLQQNKKDAKKLNDKETKTNILNNNLPLQVTAATDNNNDPNNYTIYVLNKTDQIPITFHNTNIFDAKKELLNIIGKGFLNISMTQGIRTIQYIVDDATPN